MKWVFFIFKENVFTFNQFDTLSSSLFNIFINVSRFLLEANKLVSSANKTKFSTDDVFKISFMYIINNKGPNTHPWGTPHLIVEKSEHTSHRDTHWVRSDN